MREIELMKSRHVGKEIMRKSREEVFLGREKKNIADKRRASRRRNKSEGNVVVFN